MASLPLVPATFLSRVGLSRLCRTRALLYCLYVFLPNAVSALQLSSAFSWSWKDSFGAGIGLKEDGAREYESVFGAN